MASIGFLHTAAAHVERFDLLIDERAPSRSRRDG
jgi:hypothetical protein